MSIILQKGVNSKGFLNLFCAVIVPPPVISFKTATSLIVIADSSEPILAYLFCKVAKAKFPPNPFELQAVMFSFPKRWIIASPYWVFPFLPCPHHVNILFSG
ncbi:hypothetical protein ES705_45878 [subsurface metagenome]